MLSTLQQRVERSIFEAIRLVLVANGYLPNIRDTVRYPVDGNGKPTALAQAHWDADMATIVTTKGFAIDLFGASSTSSKLAKKVPRIVIESRRSMPGDTGAPPPGVYIPEGANINKIMLPLSSTHFQMDIHLISDSIDQDRVMNAVLSKALGVRKYIHYWDDVTEKLLVLQYNYFDLPDPQDNITEKVYSYEIPDLYDFTDDDVTIVPKINQITMELSSLELAAAFLEDGTIQGKTYPDGNEIVTAGGIDYNP